MLVLIVTTVASEMKERFWVSSVKRVGYRKRGMRCLGYTVVILKVKKERIINLSIKFTNLLTLHCYEAVISAGQCPETSLRAENSTRWFSAKSVPRVGLGVKESKILYHWVNVSYTILWPLPQCDSNLSPVKDSFA